MGRCAAEWDSGQGLTAQQSAQGFLLAALAPPRDIGDAPGTPSHRFENWNDRRALALPYFLRSTTRLSRVRKPPRLSTVRNSGSKFVRALERPWRTAPAWPDNPPPDTRQMTSYWPLRLDITSGCEIIMRKTGRAKNVSIARLLTVILPVPRLIQTRATAFLRLPVA